MLSGVFAGITWAVETVVLGIALGMSPFVSGSEAALLAPFVSTFLHDAFSAVFTFLYNAIRGRLGELLRAIRSREFKWLVLSSAIGGPVGMTGYVLAVNYMGASIGAVASAIYPAVGTVFACVFLGERVRWYRWIFLCMTIFGVIGLGYSPSIAVGNFWLGLLGAVMCAVGWGTEAVILAKCLRGEGVKSSLALNIRQTVSALIYGCMIIPVLGGIRFTVGLFTGGTGILIPTVAIAALAATVSYLLYYKAIGKIGASRAMALNITYTAWAILFTVIILKDTSVLEPMSVICAVAIVVFGILAGVDISELFGRKKS